MITKFNILSEIFIVRVTVPSPPKKRAVITQNGEDLKRNASEERTFPSGDCWMKPGNA